MSLLAKWSKNTSYGIILVRQLWRIVFSLFKTDALHDARGGMREGGRRVRGCSSSLGAFLPVELKEHKNKIGNRCFLITNIEPLVYTPGCFTDYGRFISLAMTHELTYSSYRLDLALASTCEITWGKSLEFLLTLKMVTYELFWVMARDICSFISSFAL